MLIILSTYDTKGFLMLDAQDYDTISVWHAPFTFVCREWRCDIHWFNILNRLGFCKKTTTPLEANLSKMPNNWTSLNLGMPFTSFHVFHYLWLIFVGDICVRAHSIKNHFMLKIKWLINFKSIYFEQIVQIVVMIITYGRSLMISWWFCND